MRELVVCVRVISVTRSQLLASQHGYYINAAIGNYIGSINSSAVADSSRCYQQFGVDSVTRNRNATWLRKMSCPYITTSRPWFRTVAGLGASAFTEFVSVSDAGAYSVAFATPILDSSGAVDVVAGAVIQAASIQRTLVELGTIAGSPSGRAIIVSHTGAVMAASNPNLLFGYDAGRWGCVRVETDWRKGIFS